MQQKYNFAINETETEQQTEGEMEFLPSDDITETENVGDDDVSDDSF